MELALLRDHVQLVAGERRDERRVVVAVLRVARAHVRVVEGVEHAPAVRDPQREVLEVELRHRIVARVALQEARHPVVDAQVHREEFLVGPLGHVGVHAHHVRQRRGRAADGADRHERLVRRETRHLETRLAVPIREAFLERQRSDAVQLVARLR